PEVELRPRVVRLDERPGAVGPVPLDPPLDEPARVRAPRAEIPDRVASVVRELDPAAAPDQRVQHAVDERARAATPGRLREPDHLRDGRVGRHAPHLEELVRTEAEDVEHVRLERRESALDEPVQNVVEPAPQPQRPVDELLQPRPVPGREPLLRPCEHTVREAPLTDGAERLERAPASRGDAQSSIPSSGEEGTAISRFGIRPARYASRPASIASFMARAIRTGSFASAIAVFIRIPSTPCSIVMHASDAVPTPAST